MKRTIGILAALIVLGFSILVPAPVLASALEISEYQITSSEAWAWETTPTLGNDGTTDIVVYTVKLNLGGGTLGQGDIWYQPLFSGDPYSDPIAVTFGPTDDELNDVSGDYIVYTAFDNITASSGSIIICQISTGLMETLGRADIIYEARICGDTVVWREGPAWAWQVMRYKLSWLGTGTKADILAGPTPPVFDIQIGERFVVWSELEDGQYDVYAYDLALEQEIRVTSTPGIDEQQPATSGPWVVWHEKLPGAMASSIKAKNMDTFGTQVIVDDGAANVNPNIDGDLISWESDVKGNLDIWIHRISTSETFQVTYDPGDQYSNDVFEDMVTYVDMRLGSEDVYVSRIGFLPDPAMISYSPEYYDFGDVELGSSATTIITITNLGQCDLIIYGVVFQLPPYEEPYDEFGDYAITMAPNEPSIASGESNYIEVTFTPTGEGPSSAYLSIYSNDPFSECVYVNLFGNGVNTELPPTEQIAVLLAYFDAHVIDGTLLGIGPGESALDRLNALRNMIEAAGDLIVSGQIEKANQQLLDVYNKCDGDSRPPDFVSGPGASELASMIQQLLDTLAG